MVDDSFISGYEEGREFNVVIAVKVCESNEILEFKVSLEATLSGGVVKGAMKGKVEAENY